MMRAMRAESFTGYGGLKHVEVPRPRRADGRVLVRMTAAGVTPLDHTILSGGYPRAKAPLVLGNEGAGVVEQGGGTDFPVGTRVMFTGPYGVSENGTYSEWVAVRKESLYSIPDNIEDVSASGVPAVACDWRVRRKLCVTSLRVAPLRQGRSHDLTSANEDFRAFFPVQPTTQLRLWPV